MSIKYFRGHTTNSEAEYIILYLLGLVETAEFSRKTTHSISIVDRYCRDDLQRRRVYVNFFAAFIEMKYENLGLYETAELKFKYWRM